MADLAGRHQVRLSYRQAGEIAWSISWRMALLYFGPQLMLGLLANFRWFPLSAGMDEALSIFLRFLAVGFFPMLVRKALNIRYETGFRIEIIPEKAEPVAPVTPFGADLN